jgi:hypothetical protein
MYHGFIPVMRSKELINDLCQSKQALEACTGLPVRGFVPPFNRPSHFPQKGCFSVSEMTGLHGRGRGRQSAASLLDALSTTGFSWCRLSFQSSVRTLLEKMRLQKMRPPIQPFLFRGVLAMPLHNSGFGPAAVELFRRYMDTDLLITLCAHPFQALDSSRDENSEHVEVLDSLLKTFRPERKSGKLKFCTMAEAEMQFRASGESAVPVLESVEETR